MSSIITNTSAMVALANLRSTNSALDTTSNRISTGLRVNSASDNAAYWSIATTMKSDNQAMGAVKDSLAMGGSTLAAAYTGLNSTKDVLNEIKAKLTTATGNGVDRAKVQQDITALQKQLRTIADSASFSGQNWLNTGTDAASTFNKEIVSSISRDSSNQLSVGKIDVDITSIHLYGDAANGGVAGILDKKIDISKFEAAGAAAGATVEGTAVVFNADDKISFSVSQNGGAARTVVIDKATVDSVGLTASTIRSDSDLKKVLDKAIENAGISNLEVSIDASHDLKFSSTEAFVVSGASKGTAGAPTAATTVASLGLDTADVTAAAVAASTSQSVDGIDITGGTVTTATIKDYIKIVDNALGQVTTAASTVGSFQTRVKMQSEFVSKLMDTIDQGVGSLIDADMEEESTRLKALQTQQQLGVQSLSIANSNSQNILSLFR